MARYYFHLVTGEDYERDEIGSEHADANEAYLEAFDSAQQLTLDLIRDRVNPGRHRFDVCDERGNIVFQVPFTEIYRERIGPHEAITIAQRGQYLAARVRDEIVTARGELETLWSVLSKI
jgi:hypothetical protein